MWSECEHTENTFWNTWASYYYIHIMYNCIYYYLCTACKYAQLNSLLLNFANETENECTNTWVRMDLFSFLFLRSFCGRQMCNSVVYSLHYFKLVNFSFYMLYVHLHDILYTIFFFFLIIAPTEK